MQAMDQFRIPVDPLFSVAPNNTDEEEYGFVEAFESASKCDCPKFISIFVAIELDYGWSIPCGRQFERIPNLGDANALSRASFFVGARGERLLRVP
jgi:hypothetical protein